MATHSSQGSVHYLPLSMDRCSQEYSDNHRGSRHAGPDENMLNIRRKRNAMATLVSEPADRARLKAAIEVNSCDGCVT